MTSLPTINLVVLDLDNTVYDWVGSFVPSLYSLVEVASRLLEVGSEELLTDLQKVHQRHGDTEHPLALLETGIVQERFAGLSRHEISRAMEPALAAFNRTNAAMLKPYETVVSVLSDLAAKKVPVVAYTDARVTSSLDRLERLKLKHFFAHLYTPQRRLTDAELSQRDRDFVELLPSDDRKPNPQTLKEICDRWNVPTSAALYVGDSIVRDIFMAKAAGTWSAWAKYGTEYDKSLWPKLVRVTHWSEADVRRESLLRVQAADVKPDLILERFSSLLEHFHFEPRSAILQRRIAG